MLLKCQYGFLSQVWEFVFPLIFPLSLFIVINRKNYKKNKFLRKYLELNVGREQAHFKYGNLSLNVNNSNNKTTVSNETFINFHRKFSPGAYIQVCF